MIRRYLSTEVAVLLSLILHTLAFGTWQYRNVLAQLPLFHQLAKLASAHHPMIRQNASTPAMPTITFVQVPQRRSEPRTFMETDDSQVTGQQPKDAKYYSDKSTVAANPVNPTEKKGVTPYLEGTETRMMSTETVSPSRGVAESALPPAPPKRAAPPSPPPAPPSAAKQNVEQPKSVATEGLKIVEEPKAAPAPKQVAALTPPSPPRVAEPEAPPETRNRPSPGSSSKREIGAVKSKLVATGISRFGIAAFNVAESPFGAYDKAIIRAVQSRWYALIEQNKLYERAGQVTLHFNLMPDGSVDAMQTKENSAGVTLGLFCEKAIVDSAPFEPLPESLRRLIGSDPREVDFTFYY